MAGGAGEERVLATLIPDASLADGDGLVRREGRKLRAGVALFDAAGVLRGRALPTWRTV